MLTYLGDTAHTEAQSAATCWEPSRSLLAAVRVGVASEPGPARELEKQAALDRLIAAHLDTGGMVMAATHTPLGTGHAQADLALEAQP